MKPASDETTAGARRAETIANLIIAAIVVGVSVAAILGTQHFPAVRLSTDVGPARFPIIYSGVLIVLSLLLVAGTLRGRQFSEAAKPKGRNAYLAVAAGVALTLICLVAIVYVGYVASTIVYVIALMVLMGRRNLLTTPLIAIGLTALVYFTFSYGLHVPLPVGSLFE
ncbi:tripartite tricarboxylate transporter TctB family protein [Roseospira visakhapatnamensis]|uniref:Small-conductance mechanosensitive channel n=1 Tax=Roseospira visakhapatnamensis TaxID=390880 RepID=A0A7W6WBF2_9PROT|nr:tripartite tricarboxylate transporter TctB family protein [Roseospira visakhapatnamensis]MBB4267964.1 small-conductance mechanosensitive channel [Roseospira visakhapatnamensis]